MITELRDQDGLHALARLFAGIWEREGAAPISSDTLTALAHSGNYVVGARAGDDLDGGLVGWLGGTPPGGLLLHSHILGVRPGGQTQGLGFELKQHQRRWCLARGIKLIEWTFDPLVRRNAYFNFTKLGAEASEYLVNFYGPMADGINAGQESDRLLISWRLDSTRAESAAAGRRAVVEETGGEPILVEGPHGQPSLSQSSAAKKLVKVPDDIVAVRREDPARARAWRQAVREALGGSLGAGYSVTGVTRTGWYVLERR
jgi:predicted GNAT superfamily acetyltransferase